MSLYFSVPFLVLIAILQSTLAPRLAVSGVQFDLMLLVVISWSLRRGLQEGVVWAFCGGLALDLLSGAPMGTSALALMVAAAVTALARSSVMRSRTVLPWVMAALSTFIYYLVVLLVLALMGRPVYAGAALLRQVLPAAVYNVALVMIVYGLLTQLDRRTREPELRW